MTHELEINVANYIDFVCLAGLPVAHPFGGRTKVGMRVVLYANEMPFAEASLTPVTGRRAANGGRLYQISTEQAEALRRALETKVAGLEESSAAYLASGHPINVARD